MSELPGRLLVGNSYCKRNLALGDAVGHIRQMTINSNHASNNSGIFLVTEIIMPLASLSLTLHHRRREGKVT